MNRLPVDINNMIFEFARGDKMFWKQQWNLVRAELGCHIMHLRLSNKQNLLEFVIGKDRGSFAQLMPDLNKRMLIIRTVAALEYDQIKAKQVSLDAGIPNHQALFLTEILARGIKSIQSSDLFTINELFGDPTEAARIQVQDLGNLLMVHTFVDPEFVDDDL